MAKGMNPWVVAVIAVGLILAYQNGMLDGFLGGSGTGDGGPDVIVNPTPIDTTLTLNMYNAHNRATTLGDTAKVYVDGTLKNSSVGHAGTITVNPGEQVTIFAAENSTSYYTVKEEMTVPNKEQETIDIEACAIDSSVSLVWFNENDAVNTNVTIGTGGSEDIEIQLKATSDTCFGNPDINNGAGVGFFYNTTAWSKVDLSGASSASCPSYLNGASEFTWKCYEFAALEDSNVAKFRDTVKLEATGSANADGSHAYNVTVRVLDKDYDFNARTDAEIMGFQDEDSNDLGDSTTQSMNVGFI